MFRTAGIRSVFAGAAVLAASCGSSMMESELPTQLLSVSPRGGATGVAATSDLVLSFNGPMMAGMEQYVALHQGGLTGPTMPMTCGWSTDRTTLTCRPNQPLAAGSPYSFHVGGGMMDAAGRRMGMGRYGPGMGGQWASRDMLGSLSGMMTAGWQCGNGSYGMAFGFTTQ